MPKTKPHKKQPLKEQILAFSEISKAISSDLSLDDILRLVVNVTAKLLKSSICSIQLIDKEKKELVIRATHSMSEEYNKKPPLRIGEGIAGKVVLENRPIVVKDIAKEPEYKYRDIARKEKLRSLLCVPLTVKGKVIGVVNSYTSRPHSFTHTEIAVLSSIACLAAVAIENTDILTMAHDMEEELRTRKLVERAKGILMRDEKLTEEEAYLKLQKFSMDSRKSMKDIAESLIVSYNLRRLR
ncbi:MAG: GAF and ANTAR domain-containing protein [Candidatus Saganbacteria bacterium]|nr:GAF and ANTAR domain-containing protein [Candidatus Saganbacteria bacterium]